MNNGVKVFTPRELLTKTMPFIWAKLFLRLIVVLITVGIVALGVWMLGRNEAVGIGLVIFGIVAYPTICFILNRGVGYFIRVGHIAVLVEMIKTGQTPRDGMVAHSKQMVTKRIGAAATFFLINKAVDATLNQLMRVLERGTNLLGSIPGLGVLKTFLKTATKKALKYADECCIAWIFYGPDEQSAFKGAVDGITIYFQNWKTILGSAVVTALIFLLIQYAVGLVIIFGVLFAFGATSSPWGLVGLILVAFVALAIKQAYLDSWAMIKMLHSYMSVAPTTVITFDLYTKLKRMSRSFGQLFSRVPQNELNYRPQPQMNQHAPMAQAPMQQRRQAMQPQQRQVIQPQHQTMQPQQHQAMQPQHQAMQPQRQAMQPQRPPVQQQSHIFCGECGSVNAVGTKFCGDCGKPV